MRTWGIAALVLGLVACRHGYDSLGETDSIDAARAWWDDAWNERRRLRFDNTGQAQSLVDFPVLVTLDSSVVDKCMPQGEDLRFVDVDGTVLSHEIEEWDLGGEALVWVNVPQIDGASSDDSIWLYFDNPAATDLQQAAAVWNSEYLAVWHLRDDPVSVGGNEIIDATSNAHFGTSQGAMTSEDVVDGQIGKGLDFDGSDDYLSSALASDTFTELTFSAWFRARDAGAVADNLLAQRLVSQKRTLSNSRAALGVNRDRIASYWWNGDHNVAEGTTVLEPGVLYHATLSFEGSTFVLFLDGLEEARWQEPNLTAPSVDDVRIGHQSLAEGRYLNGVIDEVRVSNIARSSDWIRAQYLSQSGAFVSIESE